VGVALMTISRLYVADSLAHICPSNKAVAAKKINDYLQPLTFGSICNQLLDADLGLF